MVSPAAAVAILWWRIADVKRAHDARLEALEETAIETKKDVGYVRGVIDAWLHENGHQKG